MDPVNAYPQGYRAGENLPTKFDLGSVLDISTAVRIGAISPEQLVGRMLLEGRADAGVNAIDNKNPKSVALSDNLRSQGVPDLARRLAVVLQEKQGVAKRLGISLDEAWNGTGKSVVGLTGKDYAARAEKFKHVASDPKNQPLLDLIKAAAENKLPPETKLYKDLADGSLLNNQYGVMTEGTQGTPLSHWLSWSLEGGNEIRKTKSDPLTADFSNKVLAATAGDQDIRGDTYFALNDLSPGTLRQAISRELMSQISPNAYKRATIAPPINQLKPAAVSAIQAIITDIKKSYGIQ
jgi:hypothetical protein